MKSIYKLTLGIWIISLLAALFFVVHHKHEFESSLFAFLPQSAEHDQQQQIETALTQQTSGRFLILIENNQTQQNSISHAELDQFAQKIVSAQGVDHLLWKLDDNIQNPLPFLPLSQSIKNQQDLVEQGLVYANHPVYGYLYDPVEDPLALEIQTLLRTENRTPVQIHQGYFTVEHEQHSYYLLIGQLQNKGAISFEQQIQLDQLIAGQVTLLRDKQIKVFRSGFMFHAAANAVQGEYEMSTIGIFSLLGVLVLLTLVFRNLQVCLLFVAALGYAILLAYVVSAAVFQTIHIISLGFAATLIGVAIDYMVHLAVKIRSHHHDHGEPLTLASLFKEMAPGLGMSLISSIIAYFGIFVMPFPGLKQMALLSICGLVFAWFAMWVLAPLLIRSMPVSKQALIQDENQALGFIKAGPKLYSALSAGLVVVAVATLWLVRWDDRIVVLNKPVDHLIVEEQSVQQIMHATGLQFYIKTECIELQDCLVQELALQPFMTKLQQENVILQYESLSSIVPNFQEFEQQYKLLHDHGELASKLVLSTMGLEALIPQALVSVKAATENQTPVEYILHQEMYKRFLLRLSDSLVTVMPVNVLDKTRFVAAFQSLQQNPHQVFVDRIGEYDSKLQSVRLHLLYSLGIAVILLLVLLVLRYRQHGFKILLKPLLASFLAMLLIQLACGSVNLMHLLGQLLVLGIGLDMSIMSHELKRDKSVWTAIQVSTATNILTFGVLALCKTPALHYFGVSVFTGLFIVWLIHYLLRNRIDV